MATPIRNLLACRAARALAFAGGASLGAQAIAQPVSDYVFSSPFEAATAAPPSFQNVTGQVLDRIMPSDRHFDALWTDFNGDGCHDAYIFDHGTRATTRLWLNRCNGTNTFVFADASEAGYYRTSPANPEGSGWLTLVDHNGDGRQDFWMRWASTRYTNGTPAGQFMPSFADKSNGCDDATCMFADMNGDGRLDIVQSNRRVVDAASGAQVHPAAGPSGYGVLGDLNGDGWPEFVQPKVAGYWSNGGSALTWRSAPALRGATFLMTLADFDNDGYVDLVTFHGAECNEPQVTGGVFAFRNDRNGGFVDVSASSGLAAIPFVGCETNYGNMIAADMDNDGLQDLVIAGSSPRVAIYRNIGGLRFQQTPAQFGGDDYKSRVAVADYDNDGRLDILKTQTQTNAGIWRNTTSTGSNRWMKVRARGPGTNTDAIGADLRWYRPGTNQLVAHMQVQANDQHAQTWLHTGVGPLAAVDMVVRFPKPGGEYRFDGLHTDQEVVVFSNGCLVQDWHLGSGWPLTAPAGCPTP